MPVGPWSRTRIERHGCGREYISGIARSRCDSKYAIDGRMGMVSSKPVDEVYGPERNQHRILLYISNDEKFAIVAFPMIELYRSLT